MNSNKPLGSVPNKDRSQSSYVPRNNQAASPQKRKNIVGILLFSGVFIAALIISFQVFNEEVGRAIRTVAPMKVTGIIEAHAFGDQVPSQSKVFMVESPSPDISASIKRGVKLFNALSTGSARANETPLAYNENMAWNDLIAAFPPKVTTEIQKTSNGNTTEIKFIFHKGEFQSHIGSHAFVEMSQTLWRRFRDELDDSDPRNLAPTINGFQTWITKETETLGTYYSTDHRVDDRNMARKAADQEFINDVREFLPVVSRTMGAIKQSSSMGISRDEALQQWRVFSKNDIPKIQRWIERNQTASTHTESDGSFEIKGKGILIVAVPIGNNIVYFSETAIPSRIGLDEFKNSI